MSRRVDFDDLIRKGEDIKAIRYFAKEYYDNGKMGHTRKLLIERVADENERLKKELSKQFEMHLKVMDKYKKVLKALISEIDATEMTEDTAVTNETYSKAIELIGENTN